MNIYKLAASTFNPNSIACIIRNGDAAIPLDMKNSDCLQFLEDWKSGAEVRKADGSFASYSEAAVRALGLEPPADPA